MISHEDRYWYVSSAGRVEEAINIKSFLDIDRKEFGNYYPSDKEAMKAREKLKKYLKNI